MTTQEWVSLWQDKVLREYICDLASACSPLEDVQTDLIATAWLAIGDCQCDVSIEFAMAEGGTALIKRYQAAHYVPARRWHDEPVRHRIQRRRKKYFVIVRHPPPKICDNVR